MSALNSWLFDTSVAHRLESGATLVTASKRLARELQQQYNSHQHQNCNQAWPTSDILPYATWLRRNWNQRRPDGSGTGVAINTLQARQLWEEVIYRDIRRNETDTEPLWNVPATVKIAMDAWRVCQQWDIPIASIANSPVADHRSFVRWIKSFNSRCDENNWIDPDSLAARLTEVVAADSSSGNGDVVLYGFYTISPQLQRLIDNLAASGVTIAVAPVCGDTGTAQPPAWHFDSEYEQWIAAASWAKSKVETDGCKRVGIIAPDLHKSRGLLEHALTEVLIPDRCFNPDPGAARPFHISLGNRLAENPAVETALILLSLFSGDARDSTIFSKLLRSPFIGGAGDELHERSRLEFASVSDLPEQLPLSDFGEWLHRIHTDSSVPKLLGITQIAVTHATENTLQQSVSQWVDTFMDYLAIWEWPGEETLHSLDFQAIKAFRNELGSMRCLDMVCNQVSPARAIKYLKTQLQDRYFEGEAPQVAVEILDVQEASGIEFDAIWIGNLNERDWPPRIHRSPLIPVNLQKQARIPQAVHDLNIELAESQLAQLLSQADDATLSYQQMDEDIELFPSPLIYTEADPRTTGSPLISQMSLNPPTMEMIDDEYGVPVEPGVTRGGVSLIKDQAACPFRAYALHRLGCREPGKRIAGLDAAQRGSLVHEILERVWSQISSSEALRALSDQSLADIIASHIEPANKGYYYRAGLGNGFLRVQGEWLQRLLQQWFEVEKSRNQPWEAHALEQKFLLTLGPIDLNLKIDRVDRLADGSLALIDYKTGIAESVTQWVGERPGSPQLPMYMLAILQQYEIEPGCISALLFAQLRPGETRFSGISPDTGFQPEKDPRIKVTDLASSPLRDSFSDWNSLATHWKENLEALAVQFGQGYAAVDPVNNACDNCGLQGFCRIYERPREDE